MIADALSRAPVFKPDSKEVVIMNFVRTRSQSDLLIKDIELAAIEDKEYQKIMQVFKENATIKNLPLTHPARQLMSVWHRISSDGDLLLVDGQRILIPTAKRKEILQNLHRAHVGITKTRQNAQQCYFWPGINEDISKLVGSCSECQRYRPSNPADPPIQSSASRPMEAVSIDLFKSAGKHYLVMVDRYSGFPFVHQLTQLNTNTMTKVLSQWFMDWGIPARLRSDGGPQFRGPFTQFCDKMHITHELSSPYHPPSNGHAEAAVKNMEYLLEKHQGCWNTFQEALLEWRNTPRSGDHFSPAQLMTGHRQRTMQPAHPINTSALHPLNRRIRLMIKDQPDTSHLATAFSFKTHILSAGINKEKLSANVRTEDHITWKRTMEGDTYATTNSCDPSHPVIHTKLKSEHGRWKFKDTATTGSAYRSRRNRQLFGIPSHRDPCAIHGHRNRVDYLRHSTHGYSIYHCTKMLYTVLGPGTSTSSETTQHGAAPISTLAQLEYGHANGTPTH